MKKVNVVNTTNPKPVRVRNLMDFSKEKVGEAMFDLVASEEKFMYDMGDALKRAYESAKTESELMAMDKVLEAFVGEDLSGFLRILRKRSEKGGEQYEGRYLSEAARIKDEQIYCYVPDQCFDLDDDSLREYIKTYID